MNASLRIAELTALPIEVEALRVEAAAEGFRFMDRLVTDWRSGVNRFDGRGEVLLGAFRTGDLVAVGGLNQDRCTAEPEVGRLRHVYVRPSARRSGVGASLVRRLLDRAEEVFRSVRLRTTTQEGADFYASLGFGLVQSETATHVWPAVALETDRERSGVCPRKADKGEAN